MQQYQHSYTHLFGHEERNTRGRPAAVTQNNLISGFMNGDIVVVEQVKIHAKKHSLLFSLLKYELVTGRRYSQFIIVDVLQGNFTNLNQAQQKHCLSTSIEE